MSTNINRGYSLLIHRTERRVITELRIPTADINGRLIIKEFFFSGEPLPTKDWRAAVADEETP